MLNSARSNDKLDACIALNTNFTANLSTGNLKKSVVQFFCPTAWDGFNCWEPTLSGKTAYKPCPMVKGSDPHYMAFRKCSEEGKWLGKDGIGNDVGWTNYTPCFTREIQAMMEIIFNDYESQIKLDIAVNTRIIELVGLSLSLLALIVSLFIFHKFRQLRNTRTRLHRHLFIAMAIQLAIRLTLYIDQAITRPNRSTSLNNHENQTIRGIDNTPILCEAAYILLEYGRTAVFFNFFVEGIYLHNLITVTFVEKLSPLIYTIVGWIVPIPLTFAWAITTWMNYGSATCWWGYNFTIYFWILEGPRFGVLMINLAFLLNIIRVLVTKLRRSNSSEIDQIRKAVRAAIVLVPLLGLTNLLNMLHAPIEKALMFAIWSYSTHLIISCQGLILACLYCFSNGEVQLVLRKYLRSRILGRNQEGRSSFRMSLMSRRINLPDINGVGPTTQRLDPRIPNQPERFFQLKVNHSKSCGNNAELCDNPINFNEQASIHSKKNNNSISQTQLTRVDVEEIHELQLFCKSVCVPPNIKPSNMDAEKGITNIDISSNDESIGDLKQDSKEMEENLIMDSICDSKTHTKV